MIEGEDNLIHAAKGGEAEAFGKLYDDYQPKIYRFVLLKVTHREEAEDLTHQVFMNAWQKISSYEHRGFPFSSWLYQIARNTVIDHYRTKRQTTSLDEMDPDDIIFAEHSHIDLDLKLQLVGVQKELRTLKQDHQDVILMRFVEELSIKETAKALKRSEGAVKLLQHRAMNELRKRLTK